VKHGCKLWPVDVSACKSELYGLLSKERPAEGEPYPAGWVHFPSDVDEEFFKQLTAESLVTHVVKGYRKSEWIKDPSRRNEALDCCVYARAAAFAVGMDRHGHDDRWWDVWGGRGTVPTVAPRSAQPAPAAPRIEMPVVAPAARAMAFSPRRRMVGRMA
jgi:phage terminase large subunit GpA-like protein